MEAEGRDIPEAMQNVPVLGPGQEIYFHAFLELTTSREAGMGLGPIPWHVIQNYCKHNDFSPAETEDMHVVIRAVDNAYLEFENKRTRAEKPKPVSTPRPSRKSRSRG